MANTIANSMTPSCLTRIFYNGNKVDAKDITIVWSDHFGRPMSGDIEDFGSSRADDAAAEADAGEGW